MRVYWIDAPYVSAGLRRTYKKKLEVFSGVYSENVERVSSDTRYRLLKKGWVNAPFSNSWRYVCIKAWRSDYKTINPVYSTMPPLNKMLDDALYTTLEMAQAAKFILINNMKIRYLDELEQLKTLLLKNVPDVEKPLLSLQEEYPEYFV